jgi:tetrahydromethanopterin S-methyltransferase subunit C
MFVGQVIPLLIGVVAGLLLSVVAWRVTRARRPTLDGSTTDLQAQVLLWLLLIAVFSAGVFVTYVVAAAGR